MTTRPASLTASEIACLGRIDQIAMLAQVEHWASINSGSGNLAGLAETAALLHAVTTPEAMRMKTPPPATKPYTSRW